MNGAQIPTAANTPQATSPKKRGALYWGCGCAFVAAVIVVFAIGFGVFRLYRIFMGPTEVIKAYYQTLKEKDYTKAYGYFSASFQNRHSLTDFTSIVNQHPELFQIKRSSFRSIKIKNNQANIGAKIWARDGTISFLLFELRREKGEWKIFDFRLMEQKSKKEIVI